MLMNEIINLLDILKEKYIGKYLILPESLRSWISLSLIDDYKLKNLYNFEHNGIVEIRDFLLAGIEELQIEIKPAFKNAPTFEENMLDYILLNSNIYDSFDLALLAYECGEK